MKILAANPSSQTKLRESLRAAYSEAFEAKRSPTADDITGTDIPYLDAVMEEILRCGGTVPGVDRQAICDTEVLGYPIKKGTVVLCSGRGASMLEPGFEIDESKRSETSRLAKTENRIRAWDNDGIGAFKPERWLVPAPPSAADSADTKEYHFDSTAGPQLAFGLGLRSCFGRRLAYLELRILLTMIVWNFELLPCPDELAGFSAIAGITYKPRQCYVRLRKAI
jgi:cytochrome P450